MMETTVNIDIRLTNLVDDYMLDAGFTKDMYQFFDLDFQRDYIELHLKDNNAIDFLIEDIKKTRFNLVFLFEKCKIKKNKFYIKCYYSIIN